MSYKTKNITNGLGEYDFNDIINRKEDLNEYNEDDKKDCIEEMIDNKDDNFDFTPIVNKIIEIQKNMQELDDYFDSLSELQSQKDEQLSDLLHYIENNELKPRQAIQLIKEIKKVRIERRNILNDIEIKRVYDANKNKITASSQRQFFLNAICKRAKELNCNYKNRRYTDEDIQSILKGDVECV